jgi:hypothetical protein
MMSGNLDLALTCSAYESSSGQNGEEPEGSHYFFKKQPLKVILICHFLTPSFHNTFTYVISE